MLRLALALALTGTAAAQTPAAVPKSLLIADVTLAGDYRYDGLSNSDRHSVVQGSLYLWRPDKLFAGLFASGVDNGASFEVDVYGGRHFDLGRTRLTIEGLAAFFPDQKKSPIPTYDFVQASLRVQRAFGPLTLTSVAAWTPKASAGAGETWKFAGGAEFAAAHGLKFSANLGRRDAELSRDRTFWDAGVTLDWRQVSLDVRYVGTNRSRSECFFTDWCASAVVSKLTWHIPDGYPR